MEKSQCCTDPQKNDKQILSNYRPVSLLPVWSKIFERLIYNSMYKHISENNLLSPNQSGFRTGDPCINQLWSITYDIFHCFDDGIETWAIFLDISKVAPVWFYWEFIGSINWFSKQQKTKSSFKWPTFLLGRH